MSYPTNQTMIEAPEGSILDVVARQWATQQSAVVPVRSTVRVGGSTLIPVAIDNGNDALKGATLAPLASEEEGSLTSSLTTLRVPTAFAQAQAIQGAREVSYSCDGTSFWIGDVALRHRGGALRIGPTRQRLDDDRQRWFIGASIVELLRAAGYPPGEYQIALCLAVPNMEVIVDQSGMPSVKERTRESMKRHLKGKVWEITRDDDSRVTEQWIIKVAHVLPFAQTSGTVVAVTRTPTGKPALHLDDGMVVIDVGGGDLHVCEVGFNPSRMINRRPGDGTIRIARALRNDVKFNGIIKNDVEAQQALVRRWVTKSSRRVTIDEDVQRVVAASGQSMLADVLADLRDSNLFVTITGGGVQLLNGLLTEVLAQEEKQAGRDYLIVDGPVSSLLNVVGALFALVFKASGK
ncbi:MAG: hypothetical protein EI684_04355 [Candidatus Viridilinea halotolerans]|uniref:ParM/StbA family protein n=1 Tax=Candidatus Viridilinea halotolerans TaxID=2491704 RepID=A0A426U6G1_9CHLR|nr:MAG: hypothetical protein EI684_04355 [Candidatus Viridilinea halotolerans]